jgi:hypothetical protein
VEECTRATKGVPEALASDQPTYSTSLLEPEAVSEQYTLHITLLYVCVPLSPRLPLTTTGSPDSLLKSRIRIPALYYSTAGVSFEIDMDMGTMRFYRNGRPISLMPSVSSSVIADVPVDEPLYIVGRPNLPGARGEW